MYGATQTVGPVHPIPPHWPYWTAVLVEVEAGDVIVEVVLVEVMTGVEVGEEAEWEVEGLLSPPQVKTEGPGDGYVGTEGGLSPFLPGIS